MGDLPSGVRQDQSPVQVTSDPLERRAQGGVRPDPQGRVIWVTTARPVERSRPSKKQQSKDPQRQRVEALHDALTGRLHTRMTAAGWHVDPTAIVGMDDGVVGHFRYPLNEDFSVTAWFAWLGEYPPLHVDTVVGVSYKRTYRVWPYLLHGYPHSELRVGGEKPVAIAPMSSCGSSTNSTGRLTISSARSSIEPLEWAEPSRQCVGIPRSVANHPRRRIGRGVSGHPSGSRCCGEVGTRDVKRWRRPWRCTLRRPKSC